MSPHSAAWDDLRSRLVSAERERDEARAEVEKWKRIANGLKPSEYAGEMRLRGTRIDELWAEVQRLKAGP